jgi:GWxTD domain-containing protein
MSRLNLYRHLGFALLFSLLPVSLCADEPLEPAELPLRSSGDLDFVVDLAGFRVAGGGTEEEIHLAIANDQVRFETEDGVLRGGLELKVLIFDEAGKRVVKRVTKLEPQAGSEADANDHAIQQVVWERVALQPGTYELVLALTDQKARKRGILDLIRGARRRGEVRAAFEVADFSGETLMLSDLVFVRSYSMPEGGSDFGRYGIDFNPNPSRLFGLILNQVKCYVEVYAATSFVDGDPFLVRLQIQDPDGAPLTEKTVLARPTTSSFALAEGLDLTEGVPAGSYLLEVTVHNRRTQETCAVRREFEVIWAVESWDRDPDRVLQEMKLVMSDSQYETLASLSKGAREVYMAEFWRDLDPVPETAENEALLEFRRRVMHADRVFEAALQRGVLTDRGRVYVRYGPPDDVSYQYSSSTWGGDQSLERVADPAERIELGARPSVSYQNPDEFREGDVSDVVTQRGGTNIESKQLEIWSYDGGGDLLAGRRSGSQGSHRGLKFIFADEMGNGDYQLIGSTGTSDF